MLSVQHTSDFVLNIIHPLIHTFLEKTTAEQWGSFLSGSADDATKILVAELILEIIAALSNSVVTSLKSRTPKAEEHLMAELEESLPQTLSEALGIPDEVDNLRLKNLTSIIHEEVKCNLVGGGKAGITKHLTPVATINSMTDQLIHLFQKFSEKIKTFVVPRLCRSQAGKFKGAKSSPRPQVIKYEIDSELKDIINPLLENIPDSELLQSEMQHEIRKVVDEAVCSVCGIKSRKSSAFKNIRKRMKSVLTKGFAKVCLVRILAHLKKKHSEENTAINESVEMILTSLKSQFAEPKSQSADTEDTLIHMFKHLRGDKVLVFSQELSNLLYQHALPEPLPRSVLRTSFGKSSFVHPSQSKVHREIWSKTWIFLVLMNWFLTTQVNSVINRVTLPLMHKSASRMIEFSKTSISEIEEPDSEERDLEKNKKYVNFVIEKVVFTVCWDANMVPETREELISNLTETVWSKVQEEQFNIHAKVFKNIEEKIRRSLYKNLSSPENVLFLLTQEDPVIVERIVLVITKKLFTSHKERISFGKICSSLGSMMSKIFKRMAT